MQIKEMPVILPPLPQANSMANLEATQNTANIQLENMEDALQLDLQEETAVNHLYKSILKLDPDADEIDAKILARVTQRAQGLYYDQLRARGGGA